MTDVIGNRGLSLCLVCAFIWSGEAYAADPESFRTPEYREGSWEALEPGAAPLPTGWAYDMVNLADAFAAGATGAGVKVGVFDAVFGVHHPELLGAVDHATFIKGGVPVSLLDEPHNYDADHYPAHGTMVAGVIGARRNGSGMHGVAPDSRLYLFDTNSDTAVDMDFDLTVPAAESVAATGVSIINNSWGIPYLIDYRHYDRFDPADWGGPDFPEDWFDAATREEVGAAPGQMEYGLSRSIQTTRILAESGALMVVATGNSSLENPSVPAVLPHWESHLEGQWIAVAAVNRDGEATEYTNKCGMAADWCIAAPAGERDVYPHDYVWAPVGGGEPGDYGYEKFVGTSAAAPIVSGVAALTLSTFPWMTTHQLQQTVLTTAQDRGDRETYGWGIVDAAAAIRGPRLFQFDWDVDLLGQASTFSNDITGTGGLAVVNGLLELAGENTFDGDVRVAGEGQVHLTGSVEARVEVARAGALSGDGLMHSGRVDGTLLGQGLQVEGDLTLGASATFAKLLPPGSNPALQGGQGGTLSLDGSLLANTPAMLEAGLAEDRIADFPGGVEGDFSIVQSGMVWYSAASVISPETVDVRLDRANLDRTARRLGLSANQASVLHGLGGALPDPGETSSTPAMKLARAFYGMDDENVPRSLSLFDNAASADAVAMVARSHARLHMLTRSRGRINEAEAAPPPLGYRDDNGHSLKAFSRVDHRKMAQATAWGRLFGGKGKTGDTDQEWSGGVIGLERSAGTDSRVGVAASLTRSRGRSSAAGGDARSVGGGAYGSWSPVPEWRHSGAITLTHDWYDLERDLASIGASRATGKATGWSVAASTEIAYSVGGPLALEPFAGIRLTHVHRSGYVEENLDDLGLDVSSTGFNSVRSIAGLRGVIELAPGHVAQPTLNVSAQWEHEMADRSVVSTQSFAGQPFRTTSTKLGRDHLVLDAAFDVNISERLQGSIGYNGFFAKDVSAHQARATLVAHF